MLLNKKFVTVLTAIGLTAVLTAPSAHAVLIDYTAGPGLGLAITDDTFDGSLGSMHSSTIVVGDAGTVNGLTVEVAIDHTWIGDLVFRLVGPDSTAITLLSRPGLIGGDDGSSCCGNSSDSSSASPIIFDDAAGIAAEDWDASGGIYSPDDALSTFIGDSMMGSWALYIGDGAGGDLGTLDSWTLHMDYTSSESVPEPGSLVLMGLGLAGLGWSRRTRK